MQQSKKIGPFMNIMRVTCNKVIFYAFLLTVCRPGCIPTAIFVEDLNIWFKFAFLNFQMDFPITLNYFPIVSTQMEVKTLYPHTIIE
jgi:hypothetical protein